MTKKTLVFTLILFFSQSSFASGFLCAQDSNLRYVVRAISEELITLSAYRGFEKVYYDVDFRIASLSTNAATQKYESDIQEPDGDETKFSIEIDLKSSGDDNTARWIGIEFFHRSIEKNYAATIKINKVVYQLLVLACNINRL